MTLTTGRRDALLLALLFAFAFALRFHDVGFPPQRWGDEGVHVPAATHYWERGHFDPNLWEHPPLRHLLLYPFVAVLGDGPYGWRMRNVLFGALTAVLVALLAYAVDRSRPSAALAGLLLATDPLHVALSRFTFEEVYGVALFAGALVAFAYARGRAGWFVACGLLMGCALSTKWYYVPVWFLVTAFALREEGRWRRPADLAFVTSALLLLPVTVYALSFGPWFGRGYALAELVELTVNAYHSLQHMGAEVFNAYWPYLRLTSAEDWFVAPVMFGQQLASGESGGARFLVFGNNLPVWGLTLPAMVVCAVVAVRERSLAWATPVLCFLATYALPFVARRPSFIYNAVPLLPFAFTAIAVALSRAGAWLDRRLAWAAGAALLVSNLYLYPLATAREVPPAPYAHVLSIIDLSQR